MDISELQNLLANNSITKTDFKKGFKAVQSGNSYDEESIFTLEYTTGELDSLFENFDLNGDGKIDQDDKLTEKNFSEEIMSEKDLNLLVSELSNMLAESTPEAATQSSKIGGTGSYSGGSVDGEYSSVQETPADTNSYSNMSIEDLEAKLNSTNSELSAKQTAMSEIMNGSNSELSNIQNNITDKETKYQEKLNDLNPKLAQQYQQAKTDLDTHNQNIANTQAEIYLKEANIESINAVISSLNSQITAYETAIGNLRTQQSNSSGNVDFSAKISELETARDAAKDEKGKKEKELSAETSSLYELQTTLSTLETQTGEKEIALQTIQDEIDKLNNEDLEAIKAEITNLKDEYENRKTTLKSEIEKDIEILKTSVNEIQSELTAKRKQEIESAGSIYDAHELYYSLGLNEQGLSYENFNFMIEGYSKLEDKGTGRVSIVDEVNHNCFVIDMNTKKLIGKYRVSTGNNISDIDKANMANSYYATPGGWIKIQGVHQGGKYDSVAMNLVGKEECNSNTFDRYVLAHHINYSIGNNTLGCLGFQESVSTIKNEIMRDGGMVFVIKEGMIDRNSKYRRQSTLYSV